MMGAFTVKANVNYFKYNLKALGPNKYHPWERTYMGER